MPRFIHILFALAFLLPFAALARAPDSADEWNGAQINWRDPRSGIYEASKSGKPVIMVFHATWCTACKRYREVFKDAGVVAASKDFVMILVDADKDKEVNGGFSPDGTYVPRTLFVDPSGDVSATLVGKDSTYPHSIDIEKPDELLALMLKAKVTGFGQSSEPAADKPVDGGGI